MPDYKVYISLIISDLNLITSCKCYAYSQLLPSTLLLGFILTEHLTG